MKLNSIFKLFLFKKRGAFYPLYKNYVYFTIFPPMNNKQTIVLAEDNSTLSSMLKFRLEKEEYVILIAEDGRKAIELIEQHRPDLILTDIMMPFVSGLEVVSFVRIKLNLGSPIIVFSTAGQEEMVLKSFDLGANDFMSKPFSPNELVIRVKRLLH
ncbi:MAG: two-component system response regulator VicR [Polaribacter sp.]